MKSAVWFYFDRQYHKIGQPVAIDRQPASPQVQKWTKSDLMMNKKKFLSLGRWPGFFL